MISIGSIMHLFAGLLLAAMATFALIEAKSTSLIPRSLFLWPMLGLVFGVLALGSSARGTLTGSSKLILFTMGAVMSVCSLQAFLVNIRKIPRWPSGAVWLCLILITLASQLNYTGAEEPLFRLFFRRFSGFIWAAIGIAKVAGERAIAQEGGTPAWILLMYVQALLMASSPA